MLVCVPKTGRRWQHHSSRIQASCQEPPLGRLLGPWPSTQGNAWRGELAFGGAEGRAGLGKERPTHLVGLVPVPRPPQSQVTWD